MSRIRHWYVCCLISTPTVSAEATLRQEYKVLRIQGEHIGMDVGCQLMHNMILQITCAGVGHSQANVVSVIERCQCAFGRQP